MHNPTCSHGIELISAEEFSEREQQFMLLGKSILHPMKEEQVLSILVKFTHNCFLSYFEIIEITETVTVWRPTRTLN